MFKKVWFQIHWFIGITAGSVLMLIGVSGAMLSFQKEILSLLNPGVTHVVVQKLAMLTPEQLLQAIHIQQPARAVALINVKSEPGESAQVMFAPPPGERRGEMRYLNPYDGALLPLLGGEAVFKFIERFHRWFFLPTATGKLIAGWIASGLLILACTGLYLRWPRNIWSWRNWFRLDVRLTGRPFLWNLHSIVATWALLMYLVSALTGVYWAFDWVKNAVDHAAGEVRKTPPGNGVAAKAPPGSGRTERRHSEQADDANTPHAPDDIDLTIGWDTFLKVAPDYREASVKLPESSGKPMQITYLAHDAPHERARSQIVIQSDTGAIRRQEIYADKSRLARLTASVYPLHMGSYFGWPGRILMTLAALAMPMFGITGWLLYLNRRRTKRSLRLERQRMAGVAAPMNSSDARHVRIVYASQTGHAERLALETASLLRAAGVQASASALASFNPVSIPVEDIVLYVVSSFGDGEAPDLARTFVSRHMRSGQRNGPAVDYGILALGDRRYPRFCGFAHELNRWSQAGQGRLLFPMVEVDNLDKTAITHWRNTVLGLFGLKNQAAAAMQIGQLGQVEHSVAGQWRLRERRWLNPGSPGTPLFFVRLDQADGGFTSWRSGALVEIVPVNGASRVAQALAQTHFDGGVGVLWQSQPCTLEIALSHAELPQSLPHATTPDELMRQLQPLAIRTYSVASTGYGGSIELLVRQSWLGDHLGVASGWLTEYAPIDSHISLRILDNPRFSLDDNDGACIFIGNGSGLAGLLGHLRQRILSGHQRNWLVYGERTRVCDFHFSDEILGWLAAGDISHLDLAFSRDGDTPKYVQDCLQQQADRLLEWIAEGAVIYVCGSFEGMGTGVDRMLTDLLGASHLEDLVVQNRYRRDVY